MDANNKISIFGLNAEVNPLPDTSGAVYADDTWETNATRLGGAKEGLASSQEYNTALRQATMMAAVLSEMLAQRYGIEVGTTLNIGETTLEDHAVYLASYLNQTNLLKTGEVVAAKIADNAVETLKIKDYNVTASKLGNILGTSTGTTNGITVTLTQTEGSTGGSVNLSVSGDGTSTRANTITTESNTVDRKYILGATGPTSPATPKYDSNVFVDGTGELNATTLLITGEATAASFNATSDRRLKEDIEKVKYSTIKEIVENVDIFTFKYKESNLRSMGVIAQDLEKYNLKGFTPVSEYDGTLYVRESKLIYILWDYVKHLNERLKKLENK